MNHAQAMLQRSPASGAGIGEDLGVTWEEYSLLQRSPASGAGIGHQRLDDARSVGLASTEPGLGGRDWGG